MYDKIFNDGVFNIGSTINNICNEANKTKFNKINPEKICLDGMEYIKKEYYNVSRDFIAKNCNNDQLIEPIDIYDSIIFNQIDQWSFSIRIDKFLVLEKQRQKQDGMSIYTDTNDVYTDNKIILDDNSIIRLQNELNEDIENFIKIDFTEYINKLVGGK